MKRNWIKYLLLGLIIILILSRINYGYIHSKMIGIPYGIALVDRTKLDIPKIPANWNRFPKDDNLSATQIWINNDTTIPRHYAKVVMLPDRQKSYKTLSFESDRYIISADSLTQTDLVITVNYDKLKNNMDFKSYELVKISRLDTSDYISNWFKEKEIIKKLTHKEAFELLKDKGLK